MSNVQKAMDASAHKINVLREYRSAHTPAKGESSSVGKKPANTNSVTIHPLCVSSVIDHMIAYWTREVPNIDIL